MVGGRRLLVLVVEGQDPAPVAPLAEANFERVEFMVVVVLMRVWNAGVSPCIAVSCQTGLEVVERAVGVDEVVLVEDEQPVPARGSDPGLGACVILKEVAKLGQEMDRLSMGERMTFELRLVAFARHPQDDQNEQRLSQLARECGERFNGALPSADPQPLGTARRLAHPNRALVLFPWVK